MKHYELLYIIPEAVPEEKYNKIKVEIESLIKKNGGQITLSESIGRRKLAYPIKKVKTGYYFLNEFDLEPKSLKAIDKKLKLIEEVIRFLIVVKTPQKQPEKKVKEAFPLAKKKEAIKEKEEKKKTKKKKVSIEELDKKLDEILQGDITDQ